MTTRFAVCNLRIIYSYSDDCTIFECVMYKVIELLTAIVMTVLSLNVLCIKLQNFTYSYSDDCTIFECVVYKVTELLTAIVMTVLSLNVLCIKL